MSFNKDILTSATLNDLATNTTSPFNNGTETLTIKPFSPEDINSKLGTDLNNIRSMTYASEKVTGLEAIVKSFSSNIEDHIVNNMELNDLSDVTIEDLETGDILQYTNGNWINRSLSAATTSAINDNVYQYLTEDYIPYYDGSIFRDSQLYIDGSTIKVSYISGTNATFDNINGNIGNFNTLNVLSANISNVTVLSATSALDFTTTTSNPTWLEGRVFYDNQEKALSYYNDSSDVTINIGQEMLVRVVNKSGSPLTNGQLVYISSASGSRPVASLAIANDYSKARCTIGMVTETTIGNNNFGYVCTNGLVHGVNTAAFNVGDILWLSTSAAGSFTKIEPTSQYHKIKIGIVVDSHAIHGTIYINIHFMQNKFGNLITGNQSVFEDDGTLIFQGDATVYKDELGDIIQLQQTGPGVSINLTEGTVEFTTTSNLSDFVITNVQLNHERLLSASIYPHIHWFQATSASPNFLLQYRWQCNGCPKVTAWTNIRCNNLAFTYTSGTLNQISLTSAIIPPPTTNVSDIVQFKIFRDNANNSGAFTGADPLNATASLTSFDVHFVVDMCGSHTEYSK